MLNWLCRILLSIGFGEKRMLVLLAEDSDTLRAAMAAQLTLMGHEVHPVCNGWHAVLSWHAYDYDLVLMDMHMPVMDGWDATSTIRDLEQTNQRHRMLIVAVTSLFDRQECLAGGMDDYLAKPYSAMQLNAVLTRWAMKKKAASRIALKRPLNDALTMHSPHA
jgi:CheY-like chemotaxis protein